MAFIVHVVANKDICLKTRVAPNFVRIGIENVKWDFHAMPPFQYQTTVAEKNNFQLLPSPVFLRHPAH